MMTFTDALKSADLSAIRSFPKADLHNHFVLGGNREYIFEKTGYKIDPISKPLTSMNEMDSWSAKFIGNRYNSPEGRKLLIEATFAQAKYDGVTILKWILKIVLGILRLVLEVAKIFLLLLNLVFRVFN